MQLESTAFSELLVTEQRVQEWAEAFIASSCIAEILKDFIMYQIKRESTKENGISYQTKDCS